MFFLNQTHDETQSRIEARVLSTECNSSASNYQPTHKVFYPI